MNQFLLWETELELVQGKQLNTAHMLEVFTFFDINDGSKKDDFNPSPHAAQYFGRETSLSDDIFVVSETGNSDWGTNVAYTFFKLEDFTKTQIHRYAHSTTHSWINGLCSSGDTFVTSLNDPQDRHLIVWKIIRDSSAQPTGVSKFAEYIETSNTVGGNLSTNGKLIAVGVSGSTLHGVNTGRVTLFKINDNGSIEKLTTISPPAQEAGMKFGSAVEFIDDILLVGSSHAENQSAGSGKIYVYLTSDEGILNEPLQIYPSTVQSGDTFGSFIETSGNYMVVSGGQSTLYLYEISGQNLSNWVKQGVPPVGLNSTTALSITENQPVGTIVGEFNATDQEGGVITYHFVNGENNNSLFTLDTNGTLKTATTFDYESNASSYTISVQAKDELNATTEGNFTVTLLDVFEDTDGDGFSDQDENLAGTNPTDPSSKPGLDFGLLGYWPLDGNASDQSIHQRDGTLYGGPTFQIGTVGQGLLFDGNNDSLVLPSFTLGGQMSIAFSARIDRFRNWDAVMDFANSSASKNLKINMSDSGATIREMIFQMNTPGGDRWVGEPFWVLDKWVHLVLTVDKDATIRLYRSGKLIATEPGTEFAEEIARTKHYMGKSTHNSNYFKGMLDEVRIYNRAILPYEAQLLASAGNAVPQDLNISTPLTLLENKPVGTLVGEFTAIDDDGWDVLSYQLVPGVADNHLFTLDTNGTLKTATTFDYESNASSYTISVQAKDELNATTEGNFTSYSFGCIRTIPRESYRRAKLLRQFGNDLGRTRHIYYGAGWG